MTNSPRIGRAANALDCSSNTQEVNTGGSSPSSWIEYSSYQRRSDDYYCCIRCGYDNQKELVCNYDMGGGPFPSAIDICPNCGAQCSVHRDDSIGRYKHTFETQPSPWWMFWNKTRTVCIDKKWIPKDVFST